MERYVVGFAFNKDAGEILLVKKLRPRWMRGLLNGIGGHIEKGEPPLDAMKRECKEETGITQITWIYKGIMNGTNNDMKSFECHIFYAHSQNIYRYRQIEDEQLGIYQVSNLQREQMISNTRFLIPLGAYPQNGLTFIHLVY